MMKKLKANRWLVLLCLMAAAFAFTVAQAGLWPAPQDEETAAFAITRDTSAIDRMASQPVSFAPMLEEITPAVVAVTVSKIVRVVNNRGYVSPEEELFRRFFGLPMPNRRPLTEEDVEERKLPAGMGSGVIISKDGYILTNNHVVQDERGQDADEVLVHLNDGRELVAEIIGRDPSTDVALLKVEGEALPHIPVADSDQTRVGDVVFAIGNPLGVGLTVTKGIVSAVGRDINLYGEEGYESFIQTDASINPGNSGGALVDIDGRLVGINSAILSRTGGNIGIGFAIPANLGLAIAKHLVHYGEVRRGFLGVNIMDLTPDMAEAFGMENTEGALVNEVVAGYPADAAGIERGDIITRINDRPVRDSNELRLRIAETPPGTGVEVVFLRGGREQTRMVELADLEGSLGRDLLEGVTLSALDEAMRAEMRMVEDLAGVVVEEVDPLGPYARYLRAGMVILEVNDRAVSSVQDLRGELHDGVNKFYIYERGNTGYLALRVR